MAACIFVDFAEGCTGAAGQVPRWVTSPRSSASGLFPQGAPRWDLLIKAAHVPKNPKSLHFLLRQPVCGCGGRAHDKQWKITLAFLFLTIWNVPSLKATYPKLCFCQMGEHCFDHSCSSVAQGGTGGGSITWKISFREDVLLASPKRKPRPTEMWKKKVGHFPWHNLVKLQECLKKHSFDRLKEPQAGKRQEKILLKKHSEKWDLICWA